MSHEVESVDPIVFAPRRREVVLRWSFAVFTVAMSCGAVVEVGLRGLWLVAVAIALGALFVLVGRGEVVVDGDGVTIPGIRSERTIPGIRSERTIPWSDIEGFDAVTKGERFGLYVLVRGGEAIHLPIPTPLGLGRARRRATATVEQLETYRMHIGETRATTVDAPTAEERLAPVMTPESARIVVRAFWARLALSTLAAVGVAASFVDWPPGRAIWGILGIVLFAASPFAVDAWAWAAQRSLPKSNRIPDTKLWRTVREAGDLLDIDRSLLRLGVIAFLLPAGAFLLFGFLVA